MPYLNFKNGTSLQITQNDLEHLAIFIGEEGVDWVYIPGKGEETKTIVDLREVVSISPNVPIKL